MSIRYRIASMILLFFLLANAVILAFAASSGVEDDEDHRRGREAALSPDQGRPKWEEAPIEPELFQILEQATPDEIVRVIVHLREQTDLEAAVGGARGAKATRSHLVSTLQATATRSQASLRAYLEEAQAAGLVESYTPFWIFNGIALRARPSVIRTVAAHPSVATIRLDHYRQWISPQSPNLESSNPQSIEWNIDRIRAPQIWSSLHISGTGAVVAGMDTGVDWLHPALQTNYRGYNPHGPPNNTYSWHDSTDGGALYPVDGSGHGSHTMGIIVGQDGIGVAPGARWIGVRVLNSKGYGHDSWIHDGFQWLLAPGGDPAQAPDVVNCSWGKDNGYEIVFQPDLQALRAAGILPVISNGNSGPDRGTVGSPASLPEAFAVGASDEYDETANFSSRGPSPWGEIRPHVVAPGVNVRSSVPGGAYSLENGTSMAAPHISGIVALLRSVSPTLSITRTTFLITSTAVPPQGWEPLRDYALGDPIPNNDTGWGRVDAFAAVAALTRPGIISGTVCRAGDAAPIAGATVKAVPRSGEGGGTATTGDDGSYRLELAPDIYDLVASAFGHESARKWRVVAITDTTTTANFSLTPLPTGVLRGQITDAATGQPITATIAVLDTPFQVVADAYTFDLPGGSYTLRASRLGYRVVTATAVVTAGQVTIANLALSPAPSILLVDSGGWYYESQVRYFRQALDDLAYICDEWPIRHLPDDLPAASDLIPYDIVIWSAPRDAPGYIGAEDAVSGYLSNGGRLLLSGQDVGFWDGGGALDYWSDYYREYLKVNCVSDNAPVRALVGLEGDIFAGLAVTITGAGGADNQSFPDVVAVVDPDAAAPLLTYKGGGCGGVRVGTCLGYRVVYLSFGLEGINDRIARQEVMGRALEWLDSPLPTVGLELDPASQLRVGPPGSVVTHTLRVRHVGQGGAPDTVSLSLDGVSWATQISAQSLSLSPCTSATVLLSVTIPAAAAWDVQDVVTLTARSSLSPSLVLSATLTSKAPAPILLVDDDRWYEQQEKYQAAMEAVDFPYDLWQIKPALGGGRDHSPSLATLQWYPILVWWTGYDWYAPVTAAEEATLAAYLDGGGRLFLSSQDFLYYHHDDAAVLPLPFSRDHLGVLTYTEAVTPTRAVGVPKDPIGDRLGPYPLDYPYGYQNWSDGVEPMPGTAVVLRDQGRRGMGLARREDSYATAFFAFPFEALPEEARPTVMERVVGWLSWLGGSTFFADRGAVAPGDILTYTLSLRNDGPERVTVSLSNTLPTNLNIVTDSITGPGSYYTPTRRLSWSGSLDPDEVVTFTYRTTVVTDVLLGDSIINTASLGIEEHFVRFHRAAVVRVGTPDLSPSSFGCDPSIARPGAAVTCTLALANAGPGDTLTVTAAISLSMDATFASGSLDWTGGGMVEVFSDTVRWNGALSAGREVVLTYQLSLPSDPVHPLLYSVAFLEDGVGGAWERAAWILPDPWRAYFPVVMRDGP